MKAQKVSVVMPVYNGADYLREAIDSVLNQTFKNFELIVVDDGSTDSTPNILRTYKDKRIRIITQENKGHGAAANSGITASSSDYIARLDADDLADPWRFEKQVEFMDSNPDYVAIGGFMEFITADGESIYIGSMPVTSEEVKKNVEEDGCPILHSSLMLRRLAAVSCGLYNEELRSGTDHEFYKRLASKGKMGNLPFCLGKYRITPGAITNQTKKVLRRRNEIVRKAEKTTLTEDEKEFLWKIVVQKDESIDMSVYYLRVGLAYMQYANNRQFSRQYLWKAVKSWYFNWPAWYNLLLTYLSPKCRSAINRFRKCARMALEN